MTTPHSHDSGSPAAVPSSLADAILAIAHHFALVQTPESSVESLDAAIEAALRELSTAHSGLDRAVFGRWSWPDAQPGRIWRGGEGAGDLEGLVTQWLRQAAAAPDYSDGIPGAILAESPEALARHLTGIESSGAAGRLGAVLIYPARHGANHLAVLAAAGVAPMPADGLAACARPLELLSAVLNSAMRRHEIEDMLGSAVRQWHSMIDAMQDVIVLTDLEGHVMRGNRALAETLGRSNKELIGQPCLKPLYRESPAAGAAVSQLIAEPGRQSFEIMMDERDWRVTMDPMLDAQGALSGIVHILSDVTDQKRMERQLAASERMKVIGRLAGGVAHEVRNPLNAILSLTEALQQEMASDSEQAQFLEMIGAQVARLSTLMRDLLDLGKPIPEANLQPESLRHICTAAIELWKMAKPPHPHSVHFTVHESLRDAVVLADSPRLQQVVMNLLDNAAQHSPPEGAIHLEIGPAELDGQPAARLRIRDEGAGIAPEHLNRVFEPFMTTRRQGTGLGLSLVQNIVENHRGTVSLFNNSPEPGCTVDVCLPLAPTENAP